MPGSLGLTLYTLLGGRDGPQAQAEARPDRPAGRLVWLHAPGAAAIPAMAELARRVIDEDGHPVLLTCDAQPPGALPQGVVHQPPPPDTPAGARAFLDHWRPVAAVLEGGALRPVLLAEAIRRAIPAALVNARAPTLPQGRGRRWPGLVPGLLAHMQQVLVIDEAAARAFRRAGCPGTLLEIAGRMEEGSAALPCAEGDRLALASRLGTRPVWLAAALPEAEEGTAIEAHRAALRLAHRMLMIVIPQDDTRAPALADRMTAQGWTVARRSLGQDPDPETEVYIADGTAGFGLFYRLAPITYLGGSLSGACARDPLEPAALGSAILHGPRAGAHAATLDRLGRARAARAVAGTADLCEALGDLLSPDRAARLAHAAWGVASEGAEATDRAVHLIRRMLGED